MEVYREISLAELFESILKDNFVEIYYKNSSGSLVLADKQDWRLKEFKCQKWFKREVITDENSKNIC